MRAAAGTTWIRALALLAFASTAAPLRAQSLIEFDPYRIRLLVAVEAGDAPARASETLSRRVAEQVEAYIGAPWSLEITSAAEPLRTAMLQDLAAVQIDALPAGWREPDKLLLATLAGAAGDWRWSVRELDVPTESWSAVLQQSTPDERALGEVAFQSLLAVFRPIAGVESAEQDLAQLRWRAGALPPRDPSLAVVQPGLLARPIIRVVDRDGVTRKTQPIDWTYLIVESLQDGKGPARVYTGLRSPLAGKRRGRVQLWALAVGNVSGSTRLVLAARSADAKPLYGYEIYALRPGQPETTLLGYTNRSGSLEIPPGPDPLRLLLVKHGNEVLARLPVAPGVLPSVTARLADDDPRLRAEGFILGLQERLVDAVVRRQVMLARLKLRIDQGELDEADKLMDQLRRLDSQQQFLLALDQRQQKARSDDPSVQRKIERMFSQARELIGQYLDPAEVNRAELELDQARRGGPPPANAPPAVTPPQPVPATAQAPSDK